MIRVAEIMQYLKNKSIQAEYYGDENAEIAGFSSLKKVKHNTLVWAKKWQNIVDENIDSSHKLVIVANIDECNAENQNFNIIACDNPKAVFFSLLEHFFKGKEERRIANTAVIETNKIGRNVSIGHHCYIGPDVIIGDNVTIEHNVTICCKTLIGDNAIIHSGVVIGTDGFGYFKNSEGFNEKVTHFGGVVIEKDVEIGANTCIDRGTIDDTFIGENVKIDNLCHIGHNVVIEKNAMVIALSMLGGSATIKENAYIAPGAMIINQVTVGDNSLVGIGAVVTKDVEENVVVAGVPAKYLRKNI